MMTQPQIDRYFALLDALLRDRPVSTSSGQIRTASAAEFMLTDVSEVGATFKHRNTRNCLFMIPNGTGSYRLVIPATDEAFMRGVFDYDPIFKCVRCDHIDNRKPENGACPKCGAKLKELL